MRINLLKKYDLEIIVVKNNGYDEKVDVGELVLR